MIFAYPRTPSVLEGTDVTLHVATTAPEFRVDFYRHGASLEHVAASGPRTGGAFPFGPVGADWGWPAYEFEIGDDWRPGVYIAMLTELGTATGAVPDASTPDGEWGKALFVVRPRAGSEREILYKLPWNTYHAYNGTGGSSLYAQAKWVDGRETEPSGFKVSTRRPGGGTGGMVMANDSADAHCPSSRRQTFAHWDAPFILWAERSGYSVDYCTDWDVHREAELLGNYNLVLSVGHDEYWSEPMRRNISEYIEEGGNVAFFSGNCCWFRVHYTDDDSAMVCDKSVRQSALGQRGRGDRWQQFDPENSVTGCSHAQAGGWWDGKRDVVGYRVQHQEHWVFEGTGLEDGQVFGDSDVVPLLGYECDGADVGWRNGVARATGRDGTPPSFTVLGTAELGPRWHATSARPTATMGTYASSSGGTVFNGATTDWSLLLDLDSKVARITRNVLDRLSVPSVRIVGPVPTDGGAWPREGTPLQVYADTARGAYDVGSRYAWEVRGKPGPLLGHDGPSSAGPILTFLAGKGGEPMTVEVTMHGEGSRRVGFGSLSFIPVTEREALLAELCALLAEMVRPGEPSAPLVDLEIDPYELGLGLVLENLVWIGDRAARIAEITSLLLASDGGSKNG
jgi:hypothetical protein